MNRATPLLTLCSLTLLALSVGACGTAQSYRLSTPVTDAKATFPAIQACAASSGLEAIEHPSSLNVRFEGSSWIQFTVRPHAYEMVVVVGAEVPEQERAARASSAKAKGDELFDCALKNPVAPPPPPATAEVVPPAPSNPQPPTSPPPPAAQCVSATAPACTQDHQCSTKNCTAGFCQDNAPGSLCSQDYHCTNKNCTGGCCQTNDPGAACTQDYHCSSKNCTSGTCQTNEAGAACTQDYHCAKKNCTGGTCQTNDAGAACTQDYHCTSKNCTGGLCQ